MTNFQVNVVKVRGSVDQAARISRSPSTCYDQIQIILQPPTPGRINTLIATYWIESLLHHGGFAHCSAALRIFQALLPALILGLQNFKVPCQRTADCGVQKFGVDSVLQRN